MKRYESTVILPTGTDDPPFCVAVPRFMCDALGCSPRKRVEGVEKVEEHKVWLRLGVWPSEEKKQKTTLKSNPPSLVVFPYHPVKQPLENLLHITARMASMPGTTFLLTWFLEQLCGLRLLSTTAVDSDEESTLLEAVYEVSQGHWLYGEGNTPQPDDIQAYAYFLRDILSKDDKDKPNVEKLADCKFLAKSASAASKKTQRYWEGDDVDQNPKLLEDAADLWRDFIRYTTDCKNAGGRFTEAANRVLLGKPFDLHLGESPKVANNKRLIKIFVNQPRSAGPIKFDRLKKKILPTFRIERCFSEAETTILDERTFKDGIITGWDTIKPELKKQLFKDYFCLPIPFSIADELQGYIPRPEQKLTYATIGRNVTSGTFTVYFKPSSEIHRKVRVEVRATPKSIQVSKLALRLFQSGFDLRTISDQYSKEDEGIKHVYDFTADFQGSDRGIGLTDLVFAKVLMGRHPKMPFLGREKFNKSIEISLPCNLANDDLFGVECSCGDHTKHCNKTRPTLCEKCHKSLEDKDELLVSDGIGTLDRCLAFRISNEDGVNKFATAYFNGAGNECNVKFEKLGDRCRWSAPLVSSIAAALSDTHNQIGKQTWNKEEAQKKISQKIIERSKIQRKKGKTKKESWRKSTARHFQYPIWPEGNLYEFDYFKNDNGKIKSLGGGKSGEVYRITNIKLVEDREPELEKIPTGHDCVLKLIKPKSVPDELARSQPPEQGGFFMKGISLGEDQGKKNTAILMKYLGEYDLEKTIRKCSHLLSLEQIFSWLIDSCYVTQEWGNKDWVHWDIKPGNLFPHNNRLYLIDFGLATKLKDGKSDENINRELKKKLYLFGKTAYHVAPEIKNEIPTTIQTPVYSLSALVCQLLGDTNILKPKGEPELPRWAGRVFGDELKNVIGPSDAGGLNEDPAKRPTVDKLIEVLKACRKKVESINLTTN